MDGTPYTTVPTSDEEAVATPPSTAHGGWKTMPYIIGSETFERVASTGVAANLTLYLVGRFHMPQIAAANLNNIWSGAANLAPVAGAFLADTYLGRFSTLAFGSIATFLGMIGLTLTAALPGLSPPACTHALVDGATDLASPSRPQCSGPTAWQMSALVASLALLAVGTGGVKPCSLPFGMDQFDRTTEAGRRGNHSFFNWYYATRTAGTVAAFTLVVYIQDSAGWAVGMAFPALLMLLAVVLFFLGSGKYVHVPPEGSALTGVVQVFVAAYRKRSLPWPSREEEVVAFFDPHRDKEAPSAGSLPLTQQFGFLNKAAIRLEGEVKREILGEEGDRPSDQWSLCSVRQVEEAKCLMRLVPIWAAGVGSLIALAQLWSFAVLQALTMDRHLGRHFHVPPASIGVVSLLSVVAFIPIYDRALVPLLRGLTGHASGITQLQRMGAGNLVSALSMVVAGLVEGKRRRVSAAGVDPPLSVAWLVPQLVLVGMGEGLNVVAQTEFYNMEFPEQMRSIATSLFYCSVSGADYVSTLMVVAVKKATGKRGGHSWLDDDLDAGRLDYYYYLLAAYGFANLFYFLVVAHYYQYKGSGGSEGGRRRVGDEDHPTTK